MISRTLHRAERLLAELSDSGPVMGLDTSGSVAALALLAGGRIIAESARPAAWHGAELSKAVDDLLSSAALGLRDLKGIAVGLGPGSYTGLRVGLSYVKGLALALGCALVGVPTFDSVALAALERLPSAPPDTVIRPLSDARKGELYSALYRVVADGVERLSEAMVLGVEDLVREVSGEVTLAGALKACDALALVRTPGARPIILEAEILSSRGRHVAALGAKRLSCGASDSLAVLEPLYVRSAEATFKPQTAVRSATVFKEGTWSVEKKSSSTGM